LTDIGWFFLSYVSGSAVTAWLIYKSVTLRSIQITIDQLIDNGYLRHKRDKDGEIEILKWNSFEDK